MDKNIFLIICILIASAYIATDIYIPSLPSITKYFNTSNSLVQYTISVYLLSLSTMQLIFGPLSDKYGRKKIMLIGAFIGLSGTVFCLFSENIYWMIFGRLWQGIGLGALSSTPRAMMSDMLTGAKLAQYNSYFAVIVPIFLASALVIGGYLEQYFSWHSTFIFMIIYLIVLILVIWKLPETNRYPIRDKLNFKTSIYSYLSLLYNKSYFRACYNIALGSAGVFSYITTSPYLLQNLAGLDPVQFGWFAVVVLVTLIFSGIINSRLISYFSLELLIAINAIIMLTAGIILLITAFLELINVYIIILPLLMFLFSCVIVISNSYAIALNIYKSQGREGAAAALLSTIQLLGGSVGSIVIASFLSESQLPLAYVYITLGLLILIPFLFPKKNIPPECQRK